MLQRNVMTQHTQSDPLAGGAVLESAKGPRSHITAMRPAWACVLVVLLILFAGVQPALGQAAQVAPAGSAAPPAPAAAMEAFTSLQSWIHEWSVPESAAPGTPILPDAASCVTLRLAGRVIGRGVSFAPGPGAALRAAAGSAMSEAERRFPLPADPAARTELVRSIAITLELAGPFVTLSPETLADAGLVLSPGIDGVAARLGDRTESIFPEAMLMAGMDGGAALRSLSGTISGSAADALREPAQVRRDLGVTFYRFRTTHLAQPGPGQSPGFLFRAGRIPPPGPPTAADLVALADSIAANLIARDAAETRDGGLRGTYLPVPDRFDPPRASPLEKAFTSLSLREYARTPGVSPEIASRALALSRAILDDLAFVEPGETPPDASLGLAAFTSAAIHAHLAADGAQAGSDRAPLAEPVAALVSRVDARLGDAAASPETLDPSERAVVAWAMSLRAARTDDPADREAASRVVRAAYLDAGPGSLVGLMPWLAWAELSLAGESRPVPASEALRQMRTLVWSHQVRPEDAGDDGLDLVGGIVFTASRSPLPSWQSIRALAALAPMLADPRLTDPADVPRELSHLLAGARFIRSLTADEALAHMFPNPGRAVGGVRAAPWDQRMTLEAGALSLITLCELIDSLETLADRPGQPAPAGDEAASPTPVSQGG